MDANVFFLNRRAEEEEVRGARGAGRREEGKWKKE